jgi:multiple sugar transport system permease protein
MATADGHVAGTRRTTIDRSRSESTFRRVARYAFDSIVYAVLIAFAFATLLPLVWLISTAFKPNALVMQMPPKLIPNPLTLHNFVAFFHQMNVWRWILNSVVVVTLVTCGHVLFYSMAGYVFAKMNFPGRRLLFWIVLATLTIPLQVIVVPLYKMMVDLAWVNTYWGLIVPSLVGPASLFLMKQFMSTLPSSLIDAARVDACSEWRIFWKIVVPLAKPGIAVMGIFTFMGFWNSFFWPLVVTQTREMRTLTVGLTMVRYAQFDYGTLMAGSVVAAVPMFIVFLAFQKYFLRGLTIGAVKG